MLFNSLTFVAFFAVVLLLHRLPLPWRAKKINLLVASYLFYAAWNPPFVVLIWISTVIDWQLAKAIHRAEAPGRRRLLLLASIATNLGILGYFKYGGFLLENWKALLQTVGIDYATPEWSIILPVGISFYTFQTMAYTLDVYLRRSAPGRSFLDFALFVTFFPQLVAGPIVRPTQLVPQFAQPRQATGAQLAWGLGLMTLGLFEKTVIADGALAPAADAVFGASAQVMTADAWLGTLAFSGQIFADFAGYSTTAIGAALCLGFSLPSNFRHPYAAIGFSDFWRRWHISLSTWLRDYLYIPLGGNRKGGGRTYGNLLLTMLLGGLWHGAAWTFVVWGGLHGLYLGVERWLSARFGNREVVQRRLFQLFLALLTYALVNVTWVFFRAQDFSTAWRLTRALFGFAGAATAVLPTIYMIQTAAVIAALVVVQWLMRERRLEEVVERSPWWVVGTAWGVMLLAIILAQDTGNAFIYFQF